MSARLGFFSWITGKEKIPSKSQFAGRKCPADAGGRVKNARAALSL